MKKYIEKLHFITHDNARYSHVEQVQLACEAGAKWVQYRCVTKNDRELVQDMNAIAEICDDWGATLVVANHSHLKGEADIQGFHIENMAADFRAIRREIGSELTLGGSANTVENLIRLAREGADYAGFGPFNKSKTKPSEFPLLAISAYTVAIKQFEKEGIDLPILAVGGIKLKEAGELMATGIHGVAVSSALLEAPDFAEAYKELYQSVLN